MQFRAYNIVKVQLYCLCGIAENNAYLCDKYELICNDDNRQQMSDKLMQTENKEQEQALKM